MENRSKILFTDLDDTLLNKEKQVTPENRRAIHQAIDRGHRVVLCTGRPLLSVRPLIQDLELTQPGSYAVAYNGGEIYDCHSQEVIYRKSLPLSYVRYIFQKAHQYDLACQTYSDTHLLTARPYPATDAYLSKTAMPYKIIPDLPDSLKEEPSKVLVVGRPGLEDAKQLHAYHQDIQKWARDKISIFYSSSIYLEHVPFGISKGFAIQWLCSYLDIPLENTVAAGDEQNDIPMLQTAKIGAAMANAVPECKACADYITEQDCEHSGLAEIIERFL